MMDSEKIVKKIILICCGIIISIIGAMIWVNGGYEKGGLLQLGQVYGFSEHAMQTGTESCIYDVENEQFIVQNEAAELYFDVISEAVTWQYLTLKLENISTFPVNWQIDFFDEEGQILFGKTYTLRSGTNNLKIDTQGDIKSIRISMYNRAGATFRIADMKLREKYFYVEDFLKKAVVIFLVCVVIYILTWAGRIIDWYVIIEFLQNFYIWLGDALGSRMAARWSERLRKRGQILCFTLMFLLMIVMNVTCGNNYYDVGRYWLFGFGILCVFIAVLSWQEPLHKLNWRNGICFTWLLLWGLTALSDLFVMKSFSYAGYIMALCSGFAIFIWNNTQHFPQILYRMLKGLEGTLPLVVVYCMIFRYKKPGILYNGCFAQHESMSMYALALLIAFMADANLLISQKRFFEKKIIACGIGAAFSCFFLYYSNTFWCSVAAGTVIFIWCGIQICHFSNLHGKGKKILVSGIITLVCAIGLILCVKYAIQTFPEKWGTGIIYATDIQKTELSEELMYALEVENPGWITGVVREGEEDRNAVWKTYIQNLNLIGNADNLQLGENYMDPANGLLQMAYRYGMFVLIPYVVLLLQCIYTAFRERKFLWSATVLAFVIVMFFENLEVPFAQPLWLMLYVGIGRFFGKKVEEDVFTTYHQSDIIASDRS